MLIGRATPIFDYDLAVSLRFQNGAERVTEFGVQVIRAFCVSDTVVFIPLTLLALIGLLLKKRWSLFVIAATTGISVWVVAYGFMVRFLSGMPGYHVVLAAPDWIIMSSYALFGVLGTPVPDLPRRTVDRVTARLREGLATPRPSRECG